MCSYTSLNFFLLFLRWTHTKLRVQNISICWLSITQRALLTHVSRPCSDWTPEKKKKQVETGRRKGLHSGWNTNGKDCIYGKVTACRVTKKKNPLDVYLYYFVFLCYLLKESFVIEGLVIKENTFVLHVSKGPKAI